MRNRILIVLLLAFCLGCTKKHTEVLDCPAKPCTMNFVSVTVQFKDKAGSAIEVKNFTVVNQRTKEKLSFAGSAMNDAGYYTVVDDGMLRKLSTKGDDIVVTGTHPTSGQVKTTTYKISGGCNCHVARLAGAETITFD